MRLGVLLVILGCLGIAFGDVYGQHPKFSNNRLNERSAERNNANRLMNTQNNNRGGYNVGEMSSDPFDENNPEQSVTNTFDTTTERNGQYQLLYEENSWLRIEWTNQHGCGGNEKTDPAKVNCNLVLQYVVETATPFPATDERSLTQKVVLKDGGNTGTPDAANNYGGIPGTTASNDGNRRGRHESEGFYYDCQKRSRNKGLFHADQKLQGDDARYTRQNPNGARSGLECPEERDYYPYWSPSPWIDIAYFTDDMPNICPLIANSSQNNNNVSYCTGLLKQDKTVPIDFFNCNKTGGKWVQSNKGIPAPECKPAPWGRDNHLGNSRDSIEMAYYDWKVPAYDDLIRYGAKPYSTNPPLIRFVLRLRYNISTDDYDPWHTNSSRDDDPWNGVFSPVTQNPTIDVNVMNQGLKLAVNTAQFGRTFQDRSHTFYITKNPTALATSLAGGAKLYNLNVRGKRGNIVQTFPAVEYDFVPAWLQVKVGDWIHIQWTGSNTHNNGEPAGDGQAGDAGEGRTGTDRQNFVLMNSLGENYPIPLDKFPDNAWNTSFDCRRPFDFDNVLPPLTTALILSTSGQIYATTQTTAIQNFDPLLNDAPASLIQGLICKVKGQPKTIYYMCTRNNNFSNRGQKGQIKVVN